MPVAPWQGMNLLRVSFVERNQRETSNPYLLNKCNFLDTFPGLRKTKLACRAIPVGRVSFVDCHKLGADTLVHSFKGECLGKHVFSTDIR